MLPSLHSGPHRTAHRKKRKGTLCLQGFLPSFESDSLTAGFLPVRPFACATRLGRSVFVNYDHRYELVQKPSLASPALAVPQDCSCLALEEGYSVFSPPRAEPFAERSLAAPRLVCIVRRSADRYKSILSRPRIARRAAGQTGPLAVRHRTEYRAPVRSIQTRSASGTGIQADIHRIVKNHAKPAGTAIAMSFMVSTIRLLSQPEAPTCKGS